MLITYWHVLDLYGNYISFPLTRRWSYRLNLIPVRHVGGTAPWWCCRLDVAMHQEAPWVRRAGCQAIGRSHLLNLQTVPVSTQPTFMHCPVSAPLDDFCLNQSLHWGLWTASPLILSFHPIDLLDLLWKEELSLNTRTIWNGPYRSLFLPYNHRVGTLITMKAFQGFCFVCFICIVFEVFLLLLNFFK